MATRSFKKQIVISDHRDLFVTAFFIITGAEQRAVIIKAVLFSWERTRRRKATGSEGKTDRLFLLYSPVNTPLSARETYSPSLFSSDMGSAMMK